MIKTEIIEIIDNPLKLRESYFINNYMEIYNSIIEFTINLDIPFKQRIWHYINDESDYIVCKKCKNRVSFNRNWKLGYKEYCSTKCSQSSQLTKEKRKKTNLEKWGVDNPSKSDIVKLKQKNTNIERWGFKSTFQNDNVREKWSKTIKNKFGVEHIFQSNLVKEKSKETNLEKWGREHFVQSDAYKQRLLDINFSDKLRNIYFKKHIDKYENYDLKFISLENRIVEIYSNKCGHTFSIHYDSLKRRIENNYEYCNICNPNNSGQSQEEKNIINWIRSLNINLLERDRSLGIELDIYIPHMKIAIEYNGLYWHSELYKDNLYHLNKTEICRNNGIELIHIWEDDWLYKRDIIKSILLNRFQLISNKIWSRKCQIKLVDNKSKNEFLDNNHIQGKCISSINIGLYYGDELVSLMTFGTRYINSKRELELLRFCNKINLSVIGSASKLLNFFTKNYEYDYITSFADISQFSGNLYTKLGFEYSHRSKPNYWWVVDGIRNHRFNFNKKKLVKEGFDSNMTEVEIMYSRGYFRIFGCGQDKYIYKK